MSAARTVPTDRDRAHLATTLAAIAGFVDAVGFLVLFGAFVAHMSGNTAAGGADLGAGSVPNAVERAVIIPVFVLALIGANVLAEVLRRRGVGRLMALMLLLEATLMLAFLLAGQFLRDTDGWAVNSPKTILVASLGTVAIGVQNVLVSRAGSVGLHTTYVSGVLTDVARATVAWGFARRDLRSHPDDNDAGSSKASAARSISVLVPVYLAFLVGAAFGGYLISHLDFWVLGLPASALLVLAWVTWDWEEGTPERR